MNVITVKVSEDLLGIVNYFKISAPLAHFVNVNLLSILFDREIFLYWILLVILMIAWLPLI